MRSRILGCSKLAIGLLLLARGVCMPSCWAADQAVFEVGGAIYGGQDGKSLGGSGSSMGYFLHFQSEWRKGRLRPNIGATLEFGSGTSTLNGNQAFLLIGGNIDAGVDFYIFKTDFIKPYFGIEAIGGWANLQLTKNSQGFTFGGAAVCGAEISTKRSDDAKRLRIGSGYRMVQGKLGTLGVVQLHAIMVTIGIVF